MSSVVCPYSTAFVGATLGPVSVGCFGRTVPLCSRVIPNSMKAQEAKIELPKEPVEKFMSIDVSTVYRRAPTWEAAKIMRMKDYDQVPVVDKEDNLNSMIYYMDLMRSILD